MTKLFMTLMAGLAVSVYATGHELPIRDHYGKWLVHVGPNSGVNLGEIFGKEEVKVEFFNVHKGLIAKNPGGGKLYVSVYTKDRMLSAERKVGGEGSVSSSLFRAKVGAEYRESMSIDEKTFVLRVSVVWEYGMENCQLELKEKDKAKMKEVEVPEGAFVTIGTTRQAWLDLLYVVKCESVEKCKAVSAAVAGSIGSVGKLSYSQQIKECAKNATVDIAIKGEQYGFKKDDSKTTIVDVIAKAAQKPADELLELVKDAANNVSPEDSPIVLVKLSPITNWLKGDARKSKEKEVASQEAKWRGEGPKMEPTAVLAKVVNLRRLLGNAHPALPKVDAEVTRLEAYIKKIDDEMEKPQPDVKLLGEMPVLNLPAEALFRFHGWVRGEDGNGVSASPVVEFLDETLVKTVRLVGFEGGHKENGYLVEGDELATWKAFSNSCLTGIDMTEHPHDKSERFQRMRPFAARGSKKPHLPRLWASVDGPGRLVEFDKREKDRTYQLKITTVWDDTLTYDLGNVVSKPYNAK